METEHKAIEALEKVALEGIKEQRRARRWGIFFKLVMLAYFLGLGYFLVSGNQSKPLEVTASEVTAVVNINGIIMDGAQASTEFVIPALQKAFENPKTKGVLLRINSPGGSPVQAGQINDEILRLKEKYPDIPVYAVVSDLCASGGYYIAVAADHIYADKASLVGSIGVRMDNFGFVEAMDNLGIERRLLTAGANKGMLDPFSPLNEDQLEHVQIMLDTTHQQFIDVVKKGRGDRLKNNPDIFSGLFWTGENSVELGLIDGLGDEHYVARELIGAETLQDFTTEKDFLQRISERVGASMSQALMQASQERMVLR